MAERPLKKKWSRFIPPHTLKGLDLLTPKQRRGEKKKDLDFVFKTRKSSALGVCMELDGKVSVSCAKEKKEKKKRPQPAQKEKVFPLGWAGRR